MTEKRRVSLDRVGDNVSYDMLSQADSDFAVSALSKGATRREVMGWLIAMGVTVSAAGSIVTVASKAVAQTPKRGGKLRVAYSTHGPSDTLDPAKFTASIDYFRGRMFYNSLIRLDDNMQPQPELAESFEANDTATEWTFKIRKDVRFHDGKPLTADDVIYSMNRHIGKDSISTAKTLVASISEWKKIDDHTVQAILNLPNAEIPVVLGTFQFKIIQNGTTDFTNPVGTGPFKIKEFKPGVHAVGVRNDEYWVDGRPYVDQINHFAITDAVARVNALLAGDVDIIGEVDAKAVKQVERTDGVSIFSVEAGQYNDIVLMQDKTPGNNADLTMGLKHLFRRDRLVKRILKGQGSIGRDHPIGSAYADHCSAVEPLPYDLDKAKHFIKKSGISAFELLVAEVGPGLSDTCLILQGEARKAGLNIAVKRVPNDGYWGAIWMKSPAHVSSWNARPTANIMLTLAYASDAPWNESQWKNEKFDKLLVDARGELDADKRAEMYCEMQRLVRDGAGTIIPYHMNYIDGIKDTIRGLTRVPLAPLGGWEWAETVWLDT